MFIIALLVTFPNVGTYMSTNRKMKKLTVIEAHNGIICSSEN